MEFLIITSFPNEMSLNAPRDEAPDSVRQGNEILLEIVKDIMYRS
jgi:hypothetical protein